MIQWNGYVISPHTVLVCDCLFLLGLKFTHVSKSHLELISHENHILPQHSCQLSCCQYLRCGMRKMLIRLRNWEMNAQQPRFCKMQLSIRLYYLRPSNWMNSNMLSLTRWHPKWSKWFREILQIVEHAQQKKKLSMFLRGLNSLIKSRDTSRNLMKEGYINIIFCCDLYDEPFATGIKTLKLIIKRYILNIMKYFVVYYNMVGDGTRHMICIMYGLRKCCCWFFKTLPWHIVAWKCCE